MQEVGLSNCIVASGCIGSVAAAIDLFAPHAGPFLVALITGALIWALTTARKSLSPVRTMIKMGTAASLAALLTPFVIDVIEAIAGRSFLNGWVIISMGLGAVIPAIVLGMSQMSIGEIWEAIRKGLRWLSDFPGGEKGG